MKVSEIIKGLRAGYRGNINLSYEVKGFCTDSRDAKEGYIFFALKGSKLDGHDFVKDALDRGAIAAVVNVSRFAWEEELPIITVNDTFNALKSLAKIKLSRLSARTVGVTGSCGKTTTKNAIRHFLSGRYLVHSSPKSYNTEVGISLTILNAPEDTEIIALELGMNHRGEISKLVSIAPLDIGVITNIRPVHIGNFASFEELKEAKAEIVGGLREKAYLVFNADDKNCRFLNDRWERKLLFGIEMGDCRAIDLAILREEISFAISFRGKKLGRINLKIPGKHNVYNILGALSVALLLEVPFDEIRELAGSFRLPPMRLETHNLNNGVILINDAYNANPFSMKEAIDYLSRFKGRKIAVLGDMLELGDYSHQAHFEVGRQVAESEVDLLLALGKYADDYANGALSAGMGADQIVKFGSRELLADFLKDEISQGDIVLFKASRACGFDEIFKEVKRCLELSCSR